MRKQDFIIPGVVKILKDRQENYEVLLPETEKNKALISWFENHFPIASWGRIEWEKVKGKTCYAWQDDSELLKNLEKICRGNQLKKQAVFITWNNALRASLYLRMDLVCNYALEIFQEDFDTWIICLDEGWCIEIYHEGEICFGRCPIVMS